MVHSSIPNKYSDCTDDYARNIEKDSWLSKINNFLHLF